METIEQARPGTPQAAGIDFDAFTAGILANKAMAVKAAGAYLPHLTRTRGESCEDFALRMQIEASPEQWQ